MPEAILILGGDNRINKIFRTTLELAAKTCLLGNMEECRVPTGTTEVVLRCLFQARKLIAQKWQAQCPSAGEEWVETVNVTVWREKVVLTRCGSYKKFVTIWRPWLDGMGCPL